VLKRCSRLESGPTMRPTSGPTWWALFCASSRPPLTSSSLVLVFPKENDVSKSLGSFDARKVRESQKHAKTRKSACNDKTK
jgi:hypothetical protein